MLRLVERRRTTDGWRALYDMHGWDMKELEEDEDADTHVLRASTPDLLTPALSK